MSTYYYNGSYMSIDESPLHRINLNANKPGVLVSGAALTTTGTQADVIQGSSGSKASPNYVLCTVVVTAAPTGTSPTLVVNVQTSATQGGTYVTVASSATINAAGSTLIFAPLGANQWYRLSWTLGGTTPSFAAQLYVSHAYIGAGA